MVLHVDNIDSAIGTIVLVSDGAHLCALDFADCEPRMMRLLRQRYGDLDPVPADDPGGFSGRLRAYLEGDLSALHGVPVTLDGTPFQREVWAALRKIRVGTTVSYGSLAARLGRPTASRAVGAANGRNPVAIVVPCHRVVGADGALTGYAGGMARKRWLLAHEGAHPADSEVLRRDG